MKLIEIGKFLYICGIRKPSAKLERMNRGFITKSKTMTNIDKNSTQSYSEREYLPSYEKGDHPYAQHYLHPKMMFANLFKIREVNPQMFIFLMVCISFLRQKQDDAADFRNLEIDMKDVYPFIQMRRERILQLIKEAVTKGYLQKQSKNRKESIYYVNPSLGHVMSEKQRRNFAYYWSNFFPKMYL